MPFHPPGSTTGGEQPPGADYSKLSIAALEKIFETDLGTLNKAISAWKDMALQLSTAVLGATAAHNPGLDPLADGIPATPRDALPKLHSAEPGSLDYVISTLSDWQGPAADEFISKALQVRQFGVSVAQSFYQLAEDAGGSWSGDTQYTLHDTLNGLVKPLQFYQDMYSNKKYGLKPGFAQVVQNVFDMVSGAYDWTDGGPSGTYKFGDGTSVNITYYNSSSDTWYEFEYRPEKYFANSPYEIAGVVNQQRFKHYVTLYGDTVEYYGDDGPVATSQTLSFEREKSSTPLPYPQLTTSAITNLYKDQYQRQLSDLLSQFAPYYVVAKEQLPVAPTAPAGIGHGDSGAGSGPGGGGSSPFGTVPGYGGGGSLPYTTGSSGGGSTGSPGGGTSSPGGTTGTSSPSSTSGWNPTQLAGYTPSPGGLGPGGGFGGSPGVLSGTGGPGAGGVSGGGVTGTGNGPASEAGLAGTAARPLPMAPMAGAGAGKDRGERQRTAFLTEDEDVWGVGDDGGAAVL